MDGGADVAGELRDFDVGTLRVRAACAPSSAELHRGLGGDETDLTGHVPWLACMPLCEYLASEPGRRLLAGRPRVFELGAGVGLPGLLAGRSASELRLSDNQPAIIRQLNQSIAENARLGLLPPAPNSSAETLFWVISGAAEKRPRGGIRSYSRLGLRVLRGVS
ncbi:hypothetical protein T492DRAFT_926827, partial [Pavlovales sp. CCMP2436]